MADRITVMRNGRVAWTGATSGIGHADLIELLGGRHVDAARAPAPRAGREALVRLRDLREGDLRGVSLEIGRGEIVGLAGLEGSGQRQVLRSVFAGTHRGAGDVTVDGKVAFVSGDRAVEGIFALWSIEENIAVSSLGAHAPGADRAAARPEPALLRGSSGSRSMRRRARQTSPR